jgi:hypothetical protein
MKKGLILGLALLAAAIIVAVQGITGLFNDSSSDSDNSSHKASGKTSAEAPANPRHSGSIAPPIPSETTPAPATQAPEPTPEPEPQPDASYDFCPTTAFSDQSVVDTGALVLWSLDPAVIVGHNNLGWNFLDNLGDGATVEITCGPTAGLYRVDGHYWLPGKTHYTTELPVGYDLVLQTCTGSYDPPGDPSTDVDGLGFSLLRRVIQ